MVCRYNLRKVKGSKYVHLSVCVCMCDNYHHIRLTLTLTSQLTNWNDCCLLMFAKQNPKLHMNKRDIQNKTWMKTTRPSISPLCNITGCLCMEKKLTKGTGRNDLICTQFGIGPPRHIPVTVPTFSKSWHLAFFEKKKDSLLEGNPLQA